MKWSQTAGPPHALLNNPCRPTRAARLDDVRIHPGVATRIRNVSTPVPMSAAAHKCVEVQPCSAQQADAKFLEHNHRHDGRDRKVTDSVQGGGEQWLSTS